MDLKNILIDKYNKTTKRNSGDCLKLFYKFNNVAVNLYFDAYDIDNISFYLVLIHDKFCYCTSLNINYIMTRNQYLNAVPPEILNKIINGNLNKFYDVMREHIKNNEFNVQQYDRSFSMALVNQNDEDKPFLYHLRKAKMQDKHFKKLNLEFNFPKNTLKSIKKAGYTIVTTSDPYKRKKLTIALDEKGIKP